MASASATLPADAHVPVLLPSLSNSQVLSHQVANQKQQNMKSIMHAEPVRRAHKRGKGASPSQAQWNFSHPLAPGASGHKLRLQHSNTQEGSLGKKRAHHQEKLEV